MTVDLLKERENVKAEDLDYIVGFAASGTKTGASKAFEILRVGDFKRGSRSVPVTADDLDQAIANFNRWKALGQEIPVDYDHAFAEGRESPAAGWYESLERKGDKLYATVRWTDKARQQIADKEYRFFSPEFSKAFTSEEGDLEGFTILAGALTNRPFLRGMTPVALSQEVGDAIGEWFTEMFEQLDAGSGGDVADTPGEVDDDKNKNGNGEAEKFKVEIDGETKEFTAEEVIALHQEKVDAEKKASDAEAEAKANKNSNETLSTRLDTMEKREKDRDFSDIFSQAKREGRVDSKEDTEKTWRETFDALGTEKTKTLLQQVPAETIPMSAQGRAGSGDQPAAPKGQHEESFRINQAVETYMGEHPEITFKQALDKVMADEQKAAQS